MFRFFTLTALTILVLTQAVPAFATSMSFQVSVTLPPHVMLNNSLVGQQSNANQLVQTQTLIRNNKETNVTSIVVP